MKTVNDVYPSKYNLYRKIFCAIETCNNIIEDLSVAKDINYAQVYGLKVESYCEIYINRPVYYNNDFGGCPNCPLRVMKEGLYVCGHGMDTHRGEAVAKGEVKGRVGDYKTALHHAELVLDTIREDVDRETKILEAVDGSPLDFSDCGFHSGESY